MGIAVGCRVQTPYGTGVVTSLPTTAMDNDDESKKHYSVAVTLDQWNLANGTAPISYFGLDSTVPAEDPIVLEEYLQQRHKIQNLASLQAHSLLNNPRQTRQLALDASPVFVLAAGRAVNGMLASNVADYLEFKSVEGLLWLDTEEHVISRVPCNKNDVFSTKLLSPMDKRRLMKFLQLAMDYATQLNVAEELLQEQQRQQNEEEEVVQSLNERHLNQGRSLARPQNKAVATDELVTLQQCMQQNMTLDSYLQSQHKLTSLKLRNIIRYALAMETSATPISLSQGMAQLRHHLQALGRYGTTAFLMPMYGSGELSQAFCRSAAVFGATYLLRRAPVGVVTSIEEKDGKRRVQGVVIAPDAMDENSPAEESSSPVPLTSKKTIKCSHVVVPQTAISQTRSSTRRILRRISLLQGKLLVDGEQRHVLLLPPSSTHPYAIHGITMDESVQVAPNGCSILHLTTTISNDDDETLGILDQAAARILKASAANGNESNGSSVVEIYSATYSYALPDDDQQQPEETEVVGMHVCRPSGQVLTADVAFEQAERIFQQICPGQEFLGLSDELDAAIKERAAERGYDDEERLMLESALGMIGTCNNSKAEESSSKDEATEGAAEEINELPKSSSDDVAATS